MFLLGTINSGDRKQDRKVEPLVRPLTDAVLHPVRRQHWASMAEMHRSWVQHSYGCPPISHVNMCPWTFYSSAYQRRRLSRSLPAMFRSGAYYYGAWQLFLAARHPGPGLPLCPYNQLSKNHCVVQLGPLQWITIKCRTLTTDLGSSRKVHKSILNVLHTKLILI